MQGIEIAASVDPRRRVDTLDAGEPTALHRALRTATRAAVHHGGVHTGTVIARHRPDGHCPRCGAGMQRATWFCPRGQL